MDRKRQLEEQVVELSRQVEDMRLRLAAIEGGSGGRASATTPRSRRDLLKLGGAAALGVAGAVGAAALGTVPAQAADGANLVLGNNNSTTNKAESPTILVDDNATNGFTAFPIGTSSLSGALRVEGGSSTVANNQLASGVDGWASGELGYGVFGISDSGVGVTGESDIGIGLFARRSGRIRQDAHALDVNGVPNYWPANEFEQVRDGTGSLWLSGPQGGTIHWRRATTFELFPNPRRVYEQPANTTTPAEGFILNIDATTIVYHGSGPSGVPAGAVAAYCAVQTYQSGVMTLYPADTGDTGVANYSVAGADGQLQMLYMMVPLSPANSAHPASFNIHNRFTAKSIHIDVWGWVTA